MKKIISPKTIVEYLWGMALGHFTLPTCSENNESSSGIANTGYEKNIAVLVKITIN